jgi:hypothetical protein
MRNHYWTCSKLADWIRGTTKGGAKTSEGWNEWERRAKAAYPIRWWLAEEGLDYLQNAVYWIPDSLYSIKYYINNRWVTKTNSLTASSRDIKPGSWCDVGNRFLPCLFNELQDFVEIELAWSNIAWDGNEARKKYQAPFWATGWFRWRTWRCPQAGLDNLKWQSELRHTVDEGWEEGNPNIGELTYQAKNALEILALYKWWTEVYPNRPDPHDAGGWTEYCDLKRAAHNGPFFGDDKTPEMREMSRKALEKTREIEESYEKENEEMLIRLIKIRNSLWT